MALKLRDARYFVETRTHVNTHVACLDALCLFTYSYCFVNFCRRPKATKSRYPRR